MAGPWEQYAEPIQAPKPWEQYAAPSERGVFDKLLGLTGERYQTWPERLVRGVGESAVSAATLPGDVMAGKQAVDINDPKFMGRVLDTAALASPVNPAVRAGDMAIPGAKMALKAEKPLVPTTEELAKAGGADIQAAKMSGLDIKGSAVAEQGRKLEQELFDSGIHPVDAPATFTKLKALQDAPPDAIFTAANLQSLRESLQATAQNFNPAAAKDQLAASRAIKGMDQFLPNVAETDVLAGAAAPTAQLFERGRGNYAAAMRSNDITGILDRANTGILERAETRAQAANSGRNIDNTIRQKVASALEKPKEVSGLSDEELAAYNSLIEGGKGRNTARYTANLMGGGGGIGQTGVAAIGAGIGGAVGGVPGALIGGGLPTAIGSGAKAIANALAKRDLRKVDELLRRRSPLYQERLANPKMSVASPEKRSAAARAIAMALLQQQGAQ
jgi:hypothetical protein